LIKAIKYKYHYARGVNKVQQLTQYVVEFVGRRQVADEIAGQFFAFDLLGRLAPDRGGIRRHRRTAPGHRFAAVTVQVGGGGGGGDDRRSWDIILYSTHNPIFWYFI